ncbi:MAG: hypothetical protein JXB05_07310 [Myxococcaceae bacterium]|nr:hypothetical protein [Myxococcaceae bacterium]
MGYSETLEVLARLHVDPRFRAAYLADPRAALTARTLTEAEQERLARIEPRAVQLAGRMMDYHRSARVLEQLTWVNPELRPELRGVMNRFMEGVLPELLNREEAITFCRFLEAQPQGLPDYVAELARCERLRIALAWGLEPGAGPTHVETFQYPVLEVLAAMAAPGWPKPTPRATRVIYTKVPSLPAVMLRAEPVAP